MFDAVAMEVDLGPEPDPARWRAQVAALLTRVRDTMDRHPGIARVPLANIPTGPGAMRVVEHLVGLLRAGGVDDQSAAWFIDVVFLYVNAASLETSIYAEAGRTEQEIDAPLADQFSRLDPAAFPNLTAVREALLTGGGDERFAFGLRLMIDGLSAPRPPGR
jgi:hypothetical protein